LGRQTLLVLVVGAESDLVMYETEEENLLMIQKTSRRHHQTGTLHDELAYE
jgi:hypothetical protein